MGGSAPSWLSSGALPPPPPISALQLFLHCIPACSLVDVNSSLCTSLFMLCIRDKEITSCLAIFSEILPFSQLAHICTSGALLLVLFKHELHKQTCVQYWRKPNFCLLEHFNEQMMRSQAKKEWVKRTEFGLSLCFLFHFVVYLLCGCQWGDVYEEVFDFLRVTNSSQCLQEVCFGSEMFGRNCLRH